MTVTHLAPGSVVKFWLLVRWSHERNKPVYRQMRGTITGTYNGTWCVHASLYGDPFDWWVGLDLIAL